MTFYLPQPPQSVSKDTAQWMNLVKSRLEQIPVLSRGVAITNPVQGDIAYYGGTAGWSRLPAGTTGQFLQTNGTGANPLWNIPTNIIGVATSGTAATGFVGEYISSTVVSTSAVALTSGTAASVTNVVLTAGDWDVWGNVAFVAGATTTATVFAGGIGTAAATLPSSPGAGAFAQIGVSVSAGGTEPAFSVGSTRVSIAGTSTVYLVSQATFAISTMGGYGFLGSRRRR